jgi:hypothetical protein
MRARFASSRVIDDCNDGDLLESALNTAFIVTLALNALWFGAGFRYFGLTPNTAAKLLVPESARESPLFPTIAASVRFLGGMNLAFAAFAVLVLLNSSLFPEPGQRALFAGVFSLAHASQFVERAGGTPRRQGR